MVLFRFSLPCHGVILLPSLPCSSIIGGGIPQTAVRSHTLKSRYSGQELGRLYLTRIVFPSWLSFGGGEDLPLFGMSHQLILFMSRISGTTSHPRKRLANNQWPSIATEVTYGRYLSETPSAMVPHLTILSRSLIADPHS
jgi:hypothetical protein